MRAETTRRGFLAVSAAGAAAFAVPDWARGQLPFDPISNPGGGLGPELITVTPTAFSAWWPSSEAGDTTVRWRAESGGWQQRTLARDRHIHAAAIGKLRPDTRYRYELITNGRRVLQGTNNPGEFTTLVAPQGRVLARIAVINDLHVGEECSGTATNLGEQSIPPCYSAPDYAARMLKAAVRALNRRRPDLVIANGDLTDRGRPREVRRALRILGGLRCPVLITRGNHDRTFPETDECGPDGDCLRHLAFPQRPPGEHALTSVLRVGSRVMVIGLDSCDPISGAGRLDLGGQLDWLEGRLVQAKAERRRVIIAFHHPVTDHANRTSLPPFTFNVDPDQGGHDFLALVARHPHVELVVHGHTHRNYVSYDDRNPHPVPFLENGACKEHPGGFAMLIVHEGGINRSFHRMTAPFCRRWVPTSAKQYFGHHPDYTLGPLSSRAFVLGRDGDPRPPATVLGPYEDPIAAS